MADDRDSCGCPQQPPPADDHQETTNKTSSYLAANPLSITTLWWLNPLFRLGHKRSITSNDLSGANPGDRAEILATDLEGKWNLLAPDEKHARNSLLKCLLRSTWRPLFFAWALGMVGEFAKLVQPLLIVRVIGYLRGLPGRTDEETIVWLVVMILSIVVDVFFTCHSVLWFRRASMNMRTACAALVYRHVLRMGPHALETVTTGKIINIMSSDVEKFDFMLTTVQGLLVGPPVLVVLSICIGTEIGVSYLPGLTFIVVVLAARFFLGRVFGRLRHHIARFTDKRLLLLNETIGTIRTVKIYGWEKAFTDKIKRLRKVEIGHLWKSIIVLAINIGIGTLAARFTTYFIIVTYVCLGSDLTPEVAVRTLSWMRVSERIIFMTFPMSFGGLFQLITSMERIQEFLLSDSPVSSAVSPDLPLQDKHPDSVISLDHVIVYHPGLDDQKDQFRLDDITMNVNKGQLTAIIGPVGSGKTSLLRTIMGSLRINYGSRLVKGSMAYVPQEPWILPDTIRNNILVGLPLDQVKYDDVMRLCALHQDFHSLAKGDETVVGERGLSLSGGQRARICLARALYHDADIYLLDDPLSAVDVTIGTVIFNDCIQKHLKDKVCILVTHQIQYLKECEHIFVLNQGRVTVCGPYSEVAAAVDLDSLSEQNCPCNTGDITPDIIMDILKEYGDSPTEYIANRLGSIQTEAIIPDHSPCLYHPTPSQDSGENKGDKMPRLTDHDDMDDNVFEDNPVIFTDARNRASQRKILRRQKSKLTEKHKLPPLLIPSKSLKLHGTYSSVDNQSNASPVGIKRRAISCKVSSRDLGYLAKQRLVDQHGALPTTRLVAKESDYQSDAEGSCPSSPVYVGPARLSWYRNGLLKDCYVHCEERRQSNTEGLSHKTQLQCQRLSFRKDSTSFSPDLTGSERRITPMRREKLVTIASIEEFDCEGGHGTPTEETKKSWFSTNPYVRHFGAGYAGLLFPLLVLVLIAQETVAVYSDWWLAEWYDVSPVDLNRTVTNSSGGLNSVNRRNVLIYTGLVSSYMMFVVVSGVIVGTVLILASSRAYDQMVTRVMRVPLWFFESNPLGNILNRFGRDTEFMDSQLPIVVLSIFSLAFVVLSHVVYTCVISPLVIAVTLPYIGGVVILRWYTIRTLRSLKYIEASLRSPTFSHLSTTLDGLDVIRAFKLDVRMTELADSYMNRHTGAWFLYVNSRWWFAMRLQCWTAIYFTAVSILVVIQTKGVGGGALGLTLTYVYVLTQLIERFLRQSTKLETYMTSVERIQEYASLDQEADDTETKPSKEWPPEGSIEFERVSLRYKNCDWSALNKISFKIKAKEKVGIVGRSGAGKTSIFTALLRLAEPDGRITIDGVNIRALNVTDLRQRLCVIPQDVMLYDGTIRNNLDPLQEFNDEQIWRVLEQVQLKKKLMGMATVPGSGLEVEAGEAGASLSLGERQLLCLARALLLPSAVVLIDEATANVDYTTDAVIREALQETFANSTVLCIAHRIESVINYDRIMVLDEGEVAEFDHPYNLLQDNSSLFSQMVVQMGDDHATRLKQLLASETCIDCSVNVLNGSMESGQQVVKHNGVTNKAFEISD